MIRNLKQARDSLYSDFFLAARITMAMSFLNHFTNKCLKKKAISALSSIPIYPPKRSLKKLGFKCLSSVQ